MKHFPPAKTQKASDEEPQPKLCLQTYWSRLKAFWSSPKVHFVYEESFFVFFLILFSYVLLCEFTYHAYDREPPVEMTTAEEATFNSSAELFTSRADSSEAMGLAKRRIGPSISEYVLMFWVFTFVVDEMVQVTEQPPQGIIQ
jgi:hypothetical protein